MNGPKPNCAILRIGTSAQRYWPIHLRLSDSKQSVVASRDMARTFEQQVARGSSLDASHWPLTEKPDEVRDALAQWLGGLEL